MDGHAADRGHIAIPKDHLAPLVPVKISLASRLYTGRRTLAQSCIFEHQQYQMKPFSLSSSTPHLQARPTLLPPSSSPLQLYIEPSPFLHIGRVSKWGRRATGRTQYICAPLCILGSRCACLHRPKPGATCACFCSTSAPDHGRKGRVKLTSTASTLMTSNALPSTIHS